MKNIIIYIALIISAGFLTGCNKEQSAVVEQPKVTKPVMQMDKPGPAPDPSKYKGSY